MRWKSREFQRGRTFVVKCFAILPKRFGDTMIWLEWYYEKREFLSPTFWVWRERWLPEHEEARREQH